MLYGRDNLIRAHTRTLLCNATALSASSTTLPHYARGVSKCSFTLPRETDSSDTLCTPAVRSQCIIHIWSIHGSYSSLLLMGSNKTNRLFTSCYPRTKEDLSGSLYCRCSLMGSNRTNQVLPPQKCEYMCTFLGSITEPKLPYNLRLARDVETESLWTDIWNWISVLKQQCEAYKEITVGRASPWTSTITRCHSDQHSVPCSSPCMLMQCESFHVMFTPFMILKNL